MYFSPYLDDINQPLAELVFREIIFRPTTNEDLKKSVLHPSHPVVLPATDSCVQESSFAVALERFHQAEAQQKYFISIVQPLFFKECMNRLTFGNNAAQLPMWILPVRENKHKKKSVENLDNQFD
ncbi:hypothetical protein AVEN_150260-1 [Araneus ventricosus]|uniref:Uncharacterized protein n=1 Tax=Araneus ventricosus TaxID=182803 RepID=A0A4Y2HCW3_ARAVE|nr:hypothetical protein AVEN_150260-1 [Araneus ventricosus]